MYLYLGKKVYNDFKTKCVEDWMELQRQFETKKRSITNDKKGKETINVPLALVETYKRTMKQSPEDAVDQLKEYAGRLVWVKDSCKIRVDCDILRAWFKETCVNTVKHVQNLLKQKESSGTKMILLVGGFSESSILQNILRDTFQDMKLIVPAEAGLAVLKGAVLFGHDPLTITSRVAKCSYGIRVFRDFVDGEHPREKREVLGTRIKCKDVFASHVKIGQELNVGEPQVSQRYTPLDADQLSLVFDIYTSTRKDPKFVTDDGCALVGQLEVDIPDTGKDRGVWVNMIFGGTELFVEAKDERTNKVSKASFNFLQ